jgi:hypothetical protein
MINELVTVVESHKAAFAIAGAWLVHAAHLVWPRLVSIYPYVRENGGVFGIAREFFVGKPQPQPAAPNLHENPPA